MRTPVGCLFSILILVGCTSNADRTPDGGAADAGSMGQMRDAETRPSNDRSDAATSGMRDAAARDAAAKDAAVNDAAANDAAARDAAEPSHMEPAPAGSPANPPSAGHVADDTDAGPQPTEGRWPLCLGCASGEQLCNGLCVGATDPAYGCDGSCKPCAPDHALATCTHHACAIQVCQPGWADCDHLAANGCEVDLSTNLSHCSACGNACADGELCGPTGCVSACTPPLSKCASACVDLTTSVANCGGCNMVCPSTAGGFPSCSAGACGALACQSGYTACGSQCLDLTTNTAACGACDHACNYTCNDPDCVPEECVKSACVPARCENGWTRCGSACVVTQIDAKHCGVCGNACADDQRCVSGACVASANIRFVSGLSAPLDLAADDSKLYWTDPGNGSVSAKPFADGAIVPLATNQAKPLHIVVDGDYAYWCNNLGGAIMRTRKDGQGTPEVVLAITSPTTFVIAGDYVYIASVTTQGAIDRLPKSGGVASTFATLPSGNNYPLQIGGMVADADTLYVGAVDVMWGPSLWRVALADGASTKYPSITFVGGTGGNPQLLGDRLYFEDGQNTHHVNSVLKADGTARTSMDIVIDQQNFSMTSPFSLYVPTDCGIYWSPGATLYLERPHGRYTLPIIQDKFQRMLIHDGTLYWSASDGTINRIPAP